MPERQPMSRMLRFTRAVPALLGLLLAVGLAPAASAAPAPAVPAVSSAAAPIHAYPTTRNAPAARPLAVGVDTRAGSPPLIFHAGGSVMPNVRNVLVFWDGGNTAAFQPNYVALLQRWQKDAQGTLVYTTNGQYTGVNGKPTTTTYGATYRVHAPFPTGHCTNPYAPVCVTNDDIANVAKSVATAHGIAPGLGTIVYVYTPVGVGSCFTATCQDASYGQYCAFHSYVPYKTGQLIYADMPHPSSPLDDCRLTNGAERFPNDPFADPAVSITNHEQGEAISDPLINAWFDAARYENGDECAYKFFGTLAGKKGNTFSHTHTYDVQAMGSNKSSGCVVDSHPMGEPVPTV